MECEFIWEKPCIWLALAWCDKLEHFFQIYHEQGEDDYQFTQEDYDTWEETEHFKELAGLWIGDKKKYPAIREIRLMRPKNV